MKRLLPLLLLVAVNFERENGETASMLAAQQGIADIVPALQEAVSQISPQGVTGRLEELTILDVQEPFKNHIAALPGAQSLALAELQDRLKELDA